jgi:hypothetical protein
MSVVLFTSRYTTATTAVEVLVVVFLAMVALSTSTTAAKSPSPSSRDKFSSDRLLVDLYGMGSFNRGAEGDFPSKVAYGRIPASARWRVPSGAIPSSGMQFSGRPGWGGGIGMTFLPARHLGLSLDQSAIGRAQGSRDPAAADFGYLRHQTSLSLMIRLPLPAWSVAPYALIGGGAQYGTVPSGDISGASPGAVSRFTLSGQGFAQLGAGLEVRVSPSLGVFSDLRWLHSGVSGLPSAQMQLRYGLRAAF